MSLQKHTIGKASTLVMHEEVPLLSRVGNLELITELFMQHTFSTTVGITSHSSQRQRLVKLLLTSGLLAAPSTGGRRSSSFSGISQTGSNITKITMHS